MIKSWGYFKNFVLGMYFGYPMCCVSQFARRSVKGLAVARDIHNDYSQIYGNWDDPTTAPSNYLRCFDCEKSDKWQPYIRRMEYLEVAKSCGVSEEALLEPDIPVGTWQCP